jgi:hypothetical protein
MRGFVVAQKEYASTSHDGIPRRDVRAEAAE